MLARSQSIRIVGLLTLATVICDRWLPADDAQQRANGKTETAASDLAKEESALLQGAWNFTSYEGDGHPESFQTGFCCGSILEFAGNIVRCGEADCTYTLNPTTNPKQIDFICCEDPQSRVWKGIYSFNGDELSICAVLSPELPRPTEFTGKTGTCCSLQTHKRATGVQASTLPLGKSATQAAENTAKLLIADVGMSCRIVMRPKEYDLLWHRFRAGVKGKIVKSTNDRLLINATEFKGRSPGRIPVTAKIPLREYTVTKGNMVRSVEGEETWLSLSDISSITPIETDESD